MAKPIRTISRRPFASFFNRLRFGFTGLIKATIGFEQLGATPRSIACSLITTFFTSFRSGN